MVDVEPLDKSNLLWLEKNLIIRYSGLEVFGVFLSSHVNKCTKIRNSKCVSLQKRQVFAFFTCFENVVGFFFRSFIIPTLSVFGDVGELFFRLFRVSFV